MNNSHKFVISSVKKPNKSKKKNSHQKLKKQINGLNLCERGHCVK